MKYPALLALFLCACLLPLQGQTTDSKPPAYRFLILVDTSTNMKRMDEFTPTIVHDLIMGGIQGRMRGGDLYGVWTFNDQVDVTFTEPTAWQPDLAKTQAQTIDRYMRAVKYQGKAKLEEAVKRIKQVVLQSDELTVLIIHDGSGVMFGTPYDVQITALYRQFYKDMSKNERPFITSFNVQERRMTAWGVDAAGGPLSIPVMARKSDIKETPATNAVAKAAKPPEPETPPAPKKAPPAPIIVKGPLPKPTPATNTPAVTTPRPPTPAPETKPKTSPEPATVSETKPSVAPPKVAVMEPPPKAPSPAPATAPVSAPAPAPASPPKPAEVAPTTVPAPTTQQAAPKPVVATTPARPPEAVKPVESITAKAEPAKAAPPKNEPPKVEPVRTEPPKAASTKIEETPVTSTNAVAAPLNGAAKPTTPAQVAGKTVDSAAQLAQTAVAVPPAAGPNWLKIGLGLLFLAGAILTAYLLGRRPQPAHGSVISQSMKRDGR